MFESLDRLVFTPLEHAGVGNTIRHFTLELHFLLNRLEANKTHAKCVKTFKVKLITHYSTNSLNWEHS